MQENKCRLRNVHSEKEIVYSILFMGKESSYNVLNQAIGTAEMFGFVKNVNGVIGRRYFLLYLRPIINGQEIIMWNPEHGKDRCDH